VVDGGARDSGAATGGAGLPAGTGGFDDEWGSGAEPLACDGDDDDTLLGEHRALNEGGVQAGSVGRRSGKDVTQAIRLFFCTGNDLLLLPLLCRLVLWFEDGGEGVFLCVGACNGTVLSWDLSMLAGLLGVVAAILLSREKQESKGSVSYANPPLSALSESSCNPAVEGSVGGSTLCKTDVSTTPAPLVVLAELICSKVPTAAASISLNRCDIAASYSPRSMLDSCSLIWICLICAVTSASSSRNPRRVAVRRVLGPGLSGASSC
jgi:hypothetical protein